VNAPLALVSSMVLEDGSRWGESAIPEQWDDMKALLLPGGVRKHFWLRSRGRSKSMDTGAATLATMLAGGVRGGDEMYAAAAGREQAGILARKMRQIAELTPELAGSVDIQNYKVITPRSGAILDVISSDLATSWGKTPRWLFIDEICNHDDTETAKGFVDALLTSLPKRRDSVCLTASTPSSPNHWSRGLWDFAMEDALWRCSMASGPAPWQDPAELESERRRLPVALWRRLYLCEWAELDDALATIEQVRACIGHEGVIGPDPAHAYVHGADLSYARDTTAVATCHAEARNGREVLVVDRLRSWRPSKGRQIPLSEVADYGSAAAREYGGMINADPYQGIVIIQKWREAGHQVKAATFNPLSNSRRASLLLSLIRERQIDLPADEPELFQEITSLRLAEGSTPGVLKLTTDGSSEGHFDRVMAVMLCAEELMTRPAGSWLTAYSTVRCDDCGNAYPDRHAACPACHPHESGSRPGVPEPAREPEPVTHGGWMSAYGAVQCGAGHAYIASRHNQCPRCRPGAGRSSLSLPSMRGIGGMR
jgi:Phage Terminase